MCLSFYKRVHYRNTFNHIVISMTLILYVMSQEITIVYASKEKEVNTVVHLDPWFKFSAYLFHVTFLISPRKSAASSTEMNRIRSIAFENPTLSISVINWDYSLNKTRQLTFPMDNGNVNDAMYILMTDMSAFMFGDENVALNFKRLIGAKSSESKLKNYFVLLLYDELNENMADFPKDKNPNFYNESILSEVSSELRIKLNRESISIDSNILVLYSRFNNGRAYVENLLWEIYTIKHQFMSNILAFTSTMIDLDQFKSSRRQNFGMIPFKGIAVNEINSHGADVKFVNPFAKHLRLESGLSVSLFRDLQLCLNFTEDYTIAGDWLKVNDGKLGGRSSVPLTTGIVDISLQQDKYRKELAKLVTILHPTYPLAVVAFAIDTNEKFSNIYVAPFQVSSWVGFLALVLVTWLILIVSIKYGPEKSVPELLHYLLGWIVQQSGPMKTGRCTLRTFIFTSYTCGFVLSSYYTASLVSMFSRRTETLNTFEDLIRLEYNFIISSETVSLLDFADVLSKNYNLTVNIMDESIIANDVLNTRTALIYYWDSIGPIFTKEKTCIREEDFLCYKICALQVWNKNPSGLVLKKGSPFKDLFNQKIVRIQETGLNERYIQHYQMKTEPTCLPKSKSNHSDLGLKDVRVLFNFLLIGILCSFFVYLIELVFHRIN